jgi:hypothetical protein
MTMPAFANGAVAYAMFPGSMWLLPVRVDELQRLGRPSLTAIADRVRQRCCRCCGARAGRR